MFTFIHSVLASVAIVGANASLAAQPIEIKSYKPTTEAIFPVVSNLLISSDEVMLVDAQFSTQDGERLVELIKATGKPLKTIFISHGDPDFYFGLEAVVLAYPEAKILATAPTVEHIAKTKQQKLEFWGPQLGDGAPESVITPDVLTADGLVFAGQKIEIVGLDSSSPHRTVLWIPESKVILGGILLDSGEHVWLADTAEKVQRETWLEQLEKLKSLGAMTVIPGHYQGVLPEKATEVIRFTKRYLKTAEKELSQTTSSADFTKAMKTHFPSLPGEQTLELGAKVLTGEMAWN